MAGERERASQSILVPSEDPQQSKDKDGKEAAGKQPNGTTTTDTGGTNDSKQSAAAKKKQDELNEEDLQLKNELEMLVERLKVSSHCSTRRPYPRMYD